MVDREPDASVLEFAFGEAALRQVPVFASVDLAEWAERHPEVRVQPGKAHDHVTLMVVGRKRAAWFGAADSLLQQPPCPVAVVSEG